MWCIYYITWWKQFKKVATVFGSIMVLGALTHCALLHSMCYLKTARINVQCHLILELMLYEFELGHNEAESTKNICWAKGEGTVDHLKGLKKFCSDKKNLDNQKELSKPKTMDSKVMLQAIETNLVSSTRRVSGELGISQSNIIHHLHDHSKSIWSCWILPHITKILQNFWLPLI